MLVSSCAFYGVFWYLWHSGKILAHYVISLGQVYSMSSRYTIVGAVLAKLLKVFLRMFIYADV